MNNLENFRDRLFHGLPSTKIEQRHQEVLEVIWIDEYTDSRCTPLRLNVTYQTFEP